LNIIVCLKRVPQTAEAEVRVDSSGKDIVKERLTFDLNESDNYALEEAIQLKEKSGGTVTAVTMGQPDSEDTLRIALAKGADRAIRIKAEDFGEVDGFMTAQLLHAVIKGLQYDVVLTGCVATDDAYYQIGPVLAELLGIPHATLVTKLEFADNKANIYRELEGGLLEHLEANKPVLATIQTGINEPRYASLIAIRRAASKEIKVIGKAELTGADFASKSALEELFVPTVDKRAEILTGSVDEVTAKIAVIVKDKGLL